MYECRNVYRESVGQLDLVSSKLSAVAKEKDELSLQLSRLGMNKVANPCGGRKKFSKSLGNYIKWVKERGKEGNIPPPLSFPLILILRE